MPAEACETALRVAAPAALVPCMFVYEPTLLLIVKDWSTQWEYVVLSVATATMGAICLAASLHGWLLAFAVMWQRMALFIAAMLLIKPGLYSDLAGFALLAVVVTAQVMTRRRAAESAQLASPGG